MQKKAILIDLDGTLLPMDNDQFTRAYLGLLSKAAAQWGYQPEEMVSALWKGTAAMVKNDGSRTNIDAFWQTFKDHITTKDPQAVLEDVHLFDDFYRGDFHKAKEVTGVNPLAAMPVRAARERGFKVILATNPIFPRIAVISRLGWLGLAEDDFDYITSYENSSFCKPNPKYFMQILENNGLAPQQCVMIGNDVDEDAIPAASLGMTPMLCSDCLINRGDKPLDGIWTGPFSHLADAIKAL